MQLLLQQLDLLVSDRGVAASEPPPAPGDQFVLGGEGGDILGGEGGEAIGAE